MDGFQHRPVMAREVVELLAPVPAGTVVDATVGGGGHAHLLLDARSGPRPPRHRPRRGGGGGGPGALAPFGDRARIVHGGFEEVADIVAESWADRRARGTSWGSCSTWGSSSPQLDRPERGFCYWGEAPLDMRMDAAQELTAATVVNEYAEARLAELIRANGEERYARGDRGPHRRRAARSTRPPTWSTRSRRRSPRAPDGAGATRHGGPSRRSAWR